MNVAISQISSVVSTFSPPSTGRQVVGSSDDAFLIGGTSVRNPIEGATLTIYELDGEPCVELSWLSADPGVEGPQFVTSYWEPDFDVFVDARGTGRCPEDYRARGAVEYPAEAAPGYYKAGDVFPETGLCFDVTEYDFGSMVSPGPAAAWHIVECDEPHEYVVYSAAAVPSNVVDEGSEAVDAWISFWCPSVRDDFTGAPLGSANYDWVQVPFEGRWSLGPVYVMCVAPAGVG